MSCYTTFVSTAARTALVRTCIHTSVHTHPQVLSEDEARKAVAAAIRLQAGRYDATPLYIPPSVTIVLPSPPPTASASAGAGDIVSSDADTAHSDSETDAETDTDLGLDSVDTAHTHTDSSADSRTSIPQKIAPKNPKLRLTYWSLDTALSAIFKGPNPRLGRPSARTKVCSLPSLSHLFNHLLDCVI